MTHIPLSSLSIDYERHAYEAAKKFLLETSKPINVIARECGYQQQLVAGWLCDPVTRLRWDSFVGLRQ